MALLVLVPVLALVLVWVVVVPLPLLLAPAVLALQPSPPTCPGCGGRGRCARKRLSSSSVVQHSSVAPTNQKHMHVQRYFAWPRRPAIISLTEFRTLYQSLPFRTGWLL